jgi:hypothetical protein
MKSGTDKACARRCLLRQLKGTFYGIVITYYCYLASCRRAAPMELQPRLGLRPNRRVVIGIDCPAGTIADGIYSSRLLSK